MPELEKRVTLKDGFEADHGPYKQRRSEFDVTFCKVCGAFTRERKPYCTEHVENAPYIAALLQRLAQQKEENENAAAGRAIIAATTAQDILRYLEHNEDGHGYRGTIKQIGFRLGVAEKVILAFAKKLAKEGLVKLYFSKGRKSRPAVELV